MRSSTLQLLSSSIKSCAISSVKTAPTYSFLRKMSTGNASETAKMQSQSQHTAGGPTNDLGIENTNINAATGVELSSSQKVLVGSVLDVGHSKIEPCTSTEDCSFLQGGHL